MQLKHTMMAYLDGGILTLLERSLELPSMLGAKREEMEEIKECLLCHYHFFVWWIIFPIIFTSQHGIITFLDGMFALLKLPLKMLRTDDRENWRGRRGEVRFLRITAETITIQTENKNLCPQEKLALPCNLNCRRERQCIENSCYPRMILKKQLCLSMMI